MNESDLERPAYHTSIGKRKANTAICKHANYAVSSSLWLVYLLNRNLEDVRINSHQRCCILRSWNVTSQLRIIIQNGVQQICEAQNGFPATRGWSARKYCW
jgi:hypothetical protein